MNFNKKVLKISTLCVAGAVTIAVSTVGMRAVSYTTEEPVAGISVSLDDYYTTKSSAKEVAFAGALARSVGTEMTAYSGDSEEIAVEDDASDETTDEAPEEEPTEAEATDKEKEDAITLNYENLGIAKVDNYLNIRESAGEDKKVIGKLPKNAGCEIYSISDDGWAKIKSGKVTGYVSSEYLVTGDEANELAKEVGMIVATVNTETLKVREEADKDSTCLTLVPEGEELEVKKVSDEWVKVVIDNDKGYVAKEYVDLSYQLAKGVFVEDVEAGTNGVSSVRADMVAFAKQFLGNRYVWGGTSLTGGVDCSGFTMRIYQHFGYNITRTSRSQAVSGRTISASSVKPGDLVFYSNGGGINHVAMYIGGGQVIHASNPRSGIKISNMYYRTPVKAVRYIND
ncbi:MAG: C40 family peptidase [Clostridiales bacterium]|nr:SH3 domain-containing C40 family peptidase [uncultured Anaerosporobacter sp.]MBS5931892.1 C40 family peptidase [Clostridiales bacterium]